MNQRDLVTRVRRTSGTLSVRLGRLERARMIEREPDPENRRSVTVTLTDRGRPWCGRPARLRRAGAAARAGLPDGALRRWPSTPRVAGLLRARRAGHASARRGRGHRGGGQPDAPGGGSARRTGGAGLRVGVTPRPRRPGWPAATCHPGRRQPVRSIGDLDRAVRAANGTLALEVLRGAEPQQLEVTLERVDRVQSASAGQ